MWLVSAGLLAGLAFLGIVLVLVLVSAGPEVFVPVVEIGLLAVTIGFLALFTRYTARSFSIDVSQLGETYREASDRATRSYVASTQDLTQAYEQSTSRLLAKMDEQGERQAKILAGLTEVLSKVLEAMERQVQLAKQTQELEQKIVELRDEEKRAGEAREAQREEARVRREEDERLRMLPRLGLRLVVEGVLIHHVKVRVWNRGMSGQNLEVEVAPEGESPRVHPGRSIGAQDIIAFDFGDVTGFPHRTRMSVACRVADAVGRRYRYDTRFEYTRQTGWFDVTTGWVISPAEFIFPEPERVG